MRTFWTLVGYEYRKIFRRRVTWAALVLAAAFAVFTSQINLLGGYYLDGERVSSNRAQMALDRSCALTLSGRALDNALFGEAAAAYAAIPEDADLYQQTEEYKTVARPYEEVWDRLGFFFYDELRDPRPTWGDDFYAARDAWVADGIADMQASRATKAALLDWNDAITTPWTFRWTTGWRWLLINFEMAGDLAAFLGAVLLAPLFAGEYSRGTDPLLRSCRHGRGRLAAAKLFTGFTVTALLFAFFAALYLLVMGLTYGYDVGDAPLQLLQIGYVYPLTVAQAAVRAVACGLGGALLFAAFLLLASAALRSAFPVVVGATVLLLLPMFFDFDPTSVPLWPLLLFNLLPSRMMKFENIFSPAPYDLFGAVLPQYVVFPAVALVLCLPLAALALRAYRRHQPA